MTKELPLKPVPRKSQLKFVGEVLRAFLIVNGLAWMGVVVASPFQRTCGSTASSHVDVRTGKPILMQLAGCHVEGEPAGAPAPAKR